MKEELIRDLDKILPVVARVHGEHHPELQAVLQTYLQVRDAPSAAGFAALRSLTQDYSVPADACPTYTRAYADLAALEAALAEAGNA